MFVIFSRPNIPESAERDSFMLTLSGVDTIGRNETGNGTGGAASAGPPG
jgi:hypothetical protein